MTNAQAEARAIGDPYMRIVDFFDRDETAGSFLREDGEGGFVGGIYRMAREIESLRASSAAKDAEIAALRKERDRLNGCLNLANERTDENFDQAVKNAFSAAKLHRENELLRKALEFYADVSKYPAPLTGGMGDLWADCGQIARAALASTRETSDAG